MFFTIGDYVAGIITGAAIALVVGAIVWPRMDMVIAVLLGMAAGAVLHLILGFIMAPLFGIFETLMPGSLIGMYGGMLFAMRDSMSAGSPTLAATALVGGIFGAAMVFVVKAYNRALHGTVLDTGAQTAL